MSFLFRNFSCEHPLGESHYLVPAALFLPASSKPLLANLPVRSKPLREESDRYPRVVVQLNETWRVIVCRDQIQWILQKRSGIDKGEPRWRSLSYCCERSALVRCMRDRNITPTMEAQWRISSLPLRIGQ